MTKPTKTHTRYSDSDLAEFKQIIEQKLSKTQKEVAQMEDQYKELNESIQGNSSDLGENSASTNLEMLSNMIMRQRKYIRDLENALIRIENKNYGICVISGELIDKKRLIAVPTTTKSVTTKLNIAKTPKRAQSISTKGKQKSRKIQTKVISKTSSKTNKKDIPPTDIENQLDEIEELDISAFEEIDEQVIKEFKDMAQFEEEE